MSHMFTDEGGDDAPCSRCRRTFISCCTDPAPCEPARALAIVQAA